MSYLALDDGAPGFPQGVSDPVVLGILLELDTNFVYGAITLFGQFSQTVLLSDQDLTLESRNTEIKNYFGLGCTLFARHYLGYLGLISFPGGT